MTTMEEVFLKTALQAGSTIMGVYSSDIDVSYKDDASPVTIADKQAESIIITQLTKAYPKIPAVAEEEVAADRVPDVADYAPFFLIDPLDGTKEFINKREDFTVNIALVENGIPVVGIVYAPAKGLVYRTMETGAERLTIAEGRVVESVPINCCARTDRLIAVTSRSHNSPKTDAFMKKIGVTDFTTVGSSLKFCLIAEGLADVYPRFGRTMEWDTAAGDAVLRAAGGTTHHANECQVLVYGKRNQMNDTDFANPHFIAWAESQMASQTQNQS